MNSKKEMASNRRAFSAKKAAVLAFFLPFIPISLLLALWLCNHPVESIDFGKIGQMFGILFVGLFCLFYSLKD